MKQRGKKNVGKTKSGGTENDPQNPKPQPQRPDEVPHTPKEIPNAPPREIPVEPTPTELDRERAENEGMIAPPAETTKQGARTS